MEILKTPVVLSAGSIMSDDVHNPEGEKLGNILKGIGGPHDLAERGLCPVSDLGTAVGKKDRSDGCNAVNSAFNQCQVIGRQAGIVALYAVFQWCVGADSEAIRTQGGKLLGNECTQALGDGYDGNDTGYTDNNTQCG